MSNKIKVGSVWVGKESGTRKEIVFIGDKNLFLKEADTKEEYLYRKSDFLSHHTPYNEKKPYWLWVNTVNGQLSEIYHNEKGVSLSGDSLLDPLWKKLEWSRVEL